MDKEFIPYEQALELKELGFDEYCFSKFDKLGLLDYRFDIMISNREIIKGNKFIKCTAPLWQQAFDWFREKGYYINIQNEENFTSFKRVTPKMEILSFVRKSNEENHYEEARLECLKKLIELVKNKQS